MESSWAAWFQFVAGLASVVGLVFSILAWRKAAAAETAAGEARQAVRRNNASEDFQELSDKARELLACAQANQFEAALLRSRDLLAGIGRANHQWQPFLSESGPRIERVVKQVGRISRALSAGNAALTPPIREKLLKSCHEVVELLAAEVGGMLRDNEGGPR